MAPPLGLSPHMKAHGSQVALQGAAADIDVSLCVCVCACVCVFVCAHDYHMCVLCGPGCAVKHDI